eukprot:CAMPEP_0195083048 /NCGR_PEP_ID=MMETSP0448-20130528/24079_1 /TAXON_ID=66468 /ORGANISM="Heterocapsa triquestra, Strain CCMP 448" /LENGTH=91 /DNA_ID=CAMNT_0040116221 /DNA_START=9 /DNA_END=282 /DNA_ORIENTATION=-
MLLLNVTKVMEYGFVSDGRCDGLNCRDSYAAAFHPLKTIGEWKACVAEANAADSEAFRHLDTAALAACERLAEWWQSGGVQSAEQWRKALF